MPEKKQQKNYGDKYLGLFNKIADPIFIFEKETCKFLDCNPAVQRNYGYSKEELKNLSLMDLHPAKEVERVKRAVKIVNKDIPFLFTHIKKNGKHITVEMLSDKMEYEGNDATISIVRDVSDRVKTETELQRRASQTALIYEISKRVTKELNLETLLAEIVNSIHSTFDFYGVMLLLMNERKDCVNLQAIAGGYANVFPSTLSIDVGEGMIGQAAADKKTHLSGDVTKNKHYVKKAEEVTVSELSVPIIGSEDVIGVLDFQSDHKNAFDKSDVEAAETLSSQIATAIENARLFRKAQDEIEYSKKLEREAKRRAALSALIYEIGQRLSGELDLESLLSTVVTTIRDSFDYYGVMLLMHDEKKKVLVLQAIDGAYTGIFPIDLNIKVGEGMIGQAALTQQSQMSSDVTKNPNFVKKADEKTKSELSVPLMKGGRVIGVLDLQSDEVNAFDESDVTLGETLSSQIAAAIENARLYNQAQDEIEERLKAEKQARRRATQADLINEISTKVSSELDVQKLLTQIVNSVRDAFDYYGVLLLLLDKKKNMLTLEAVAGGYAKYFSVGEVALEIGQGMVGHAALTKKVQISGNVDENPHYVRRAEEKTKSEISVPIISGDKVLGVLDIESEELNAFDESDITVLTTISSQIATALENAHLYQQAQLEIHDRKEAEKELRKSRNSLQSAKRETDTILQNVNEGLFILDFKHRIGSQHSRALTEILQKNDLRQKTLLEVLEKELSESEVENINDYLDLMFNSDIDEETLEELNPMANIELTLQNKNELMSTDKVLAFNFKRIIIKDKINNLISTVSDITEQSRLEKKLEESEEQSKRQMEWFLSILHIEPQLLQEFIEGVNTELNLIEATLKSDESQKDYIAVLEKIYRSVHLVKGNASLLDLKFYAKRAHDFEEEIEGVKKKKHISATDFIPLVMHLGELRSDIDEINKMIERISQIHTHFRPKRSFESQMLVKSIKNLIHTVSKDLKKEVEFKHNNFNGENIPYEYRLVVKDILVQMVRNSLRHGIESPEERKKIKKNEKGLIEISTVLQKDNFCFKFMDDGQGLQIAKLKEKALASGKWSSSEIKKWDEGKIAETIFISGISTAESADLVAGRGVGMDIIKQKVVSHGGQIEMRYEENKFLEFTVCLPISNKRKKKK